MAQAAIIDGKAFAAGLRARIADAVPAFTAATGRAPGLAVVLVGDDPASAVYVGSKGKATIAAGMASFEHRLPATAAQDEVETLLARLNADEAVDGILLQLPLPGHLDEQAAVATIDPAKDVDGLTPVSAGRLALGIPGMVPCTPMAACCCSRTGSATCRVRTRSSSAARSWSASRWGNCCSAPIAPSRWHTAAPRICPASSAAPTSSSPRWGAPASSRGDWIKPGATVIDVGINRIPKADGAAKGRLVGDVDYAAAAAVADAITPVPGGVGPMTIACLLRNTLVAAHRRAGLTDPEGF